MKAYIGSRRKILFLGASLNYSKICRSGMRYQYPALIDARVLISIRKKGGTAENFVLCLYRQRTFFIDFYRQNPQEFIGGTYVQIIPKSVFATFRHAVRPVFRRRQPHLPTLAWQSGGKRDVSCIIKLCHHGRYFSRSRHYCCRKNGWPIRAGPPRRPPLLHRLYDGDLLIDRPRSGYPACRIGAI